jgi:hypothetical protein
MLYIPRVAEALGVQLLNPGELDQESREGKKRADGKGN